MASKSTYEYNHQWYLSHKQERQEYNRQWRLEHKEQRDEYDRKRYTETYIPHPKTPRTEYQKDYYKRLRQKAKQVEYKKLRQAMFDMYGHTCACCGESIMEFLTLEHKQGHVGKKKTGFCLYEDAIREYRPDLYEILCMNCNHAKGRFGFCPHTTQLAV